MLVYILFEVHASQTNNITIQCNQQKKQEDPWNSILSGATTGGILAARAGPKAMASAAVVGGFILALIEGMGIWMNNYFSMPPPGMEGTYLLF